MKEKLLISCALICLILNAGCTNDEVVPTSNKLNLEFIYHQSINKLLLSGDSTTRSTNSNDHIDLSIHMKKIISYIKSMNQFESADFRQSYIDKIGGEAVADSIQLCRIDEFMLKLGGSKQSDRYQDFIVSYMQMKPGWSSISTILPRGISIKEQELYVTQATYLDLIARPIYDSLQMAYDSSVTVCEIHLAIDLGMNIGGMAVDAFIDEMSDGIATEELIEQFCLYGLDIVKIWHEYENCKGKPIRR